jgi:hypothetical protein
MLQLSTSQFLTAVPEITLKLFVWADPHDGEARYVFGPKGRISFGRQPTPQKLHIDFTCLTKLPDSGDRFILHEFATSRLDKIKSYNFGGHTQSKPPHESSITSAPGLLFDLDMPVDDMFYIDVLVKDLKYPHRIFSCDPQVENGTKT